MSLARRAVALVATLLVPSLLAAQTYPNKQDPRSNLKPGKTDAGVATKNMRLVSNTPKPAHFDSTRGLTFVNSDLAFGDKYVYQGNFAGFTIWDVSDPSKPKIVSTVQCITSQGDPSIIGNLLFISAEGAGNRNDCAKGGVQDPKDHMRGVRIYDVSNPAAPRLVKNVQTCKGSRTRTRSFRTRRTGTSSTSTCQAVRARGPRRKSRDAGKERIRPTIRTLSSGSTSSRWT
jgi:hypothetical protein